LKSEGQNTNKNLKEQDKRQELNKMQLIDTTAQVMKLDHKSYRLVNVFGVAQFVNNGKHT